jgi:hypothetical protein
MNREKGKRLPERYAFHSLSLTYWTGHLTEKRKEKRNLLTRPM